MNVGIGGFLQCIGAAFSCPSGQRCSWVMGDAMIAKPILATTFVLTVLASGAFAQNSSNLGKALPIDALARTVWVEEFDVSPDAKTIAYKSAKAGTYDIWTAQVGSGAVEQITSMPGREFRWPMLNKPYRRDELANAVRSVLDIERLN